MPQFKDISDTEAKDTLARGDLRLKVGPFAYCLQSNETIVFDGLRKLYGDYQILPAESFSDFHLSLRPSDMVQKWRKKIDFYSDGQRPFNRIESQHAYAFLEWGMNWCVSTTANEHLKLHAAVLAKNGIGLVLPGLPGAGKSTLAAALCLTGWRILSDEHALVPFRTHNLVPLCRPVSLKNRSIEIIKNFDTNVVLGPETHETHKGTVAHMKADLASDSHDPKLIPARLIIFPRYSQGSKLVLQKKPKTEAFMFAGLHSFNYSLLSQTGFDTMCILMNNVSCYDLTFSELDKALQVIEKLLVEVSSS
jgi:HprK-related kinase A